ncbi:MAG: pantetheine-phosphate adenylyltransferase [Nanoarchaeota archaeon]|nr:pantetheine-phosphate adenylyltransferase [Nanoarchaeota archaeon]
MARNGVYAGSFDPVTNGHLWMIDQGSKFFDEFNVAIGINPDKKYTFSIEERMQMLKEVTKDIKNLRLDSFENQFLVRYAQSIDANYILRGMRNPDDYEFEKAMRYVNGDLNKNITTIFLIPPRDLVEISSSFVKGLIGPEGWEEIIKKYVPIPVYNKFLEKYG